MYGKIVKRFTENGRRYGIIEILTWDYTGNCYRISEYHLQKIIIRCGRDVGVFVINGYSIKECLERFEKIEKRRAERQAQAQARRQAIQTERQAQARKQAQAKQYYFCNSANYYLSDIMDAYKNTINDYVF